MSREQSTIDFSHIFQDRLAKIEPMPDNAARQIALVRSVNEIDQFKRRIPAIVFVASRRGDRIIHATGIRGIWIEDDDTLDHYTYPHHQVETRMKNFLHKQGLFGAKVSSAEIIQDGQDNLHLLLDLVGAYGVDRDKKDGNQEDFNDFWVGLALEYGFISVIGDLPDMRGNGLIKFVNADLIGELRENRFLYSFAGKYNLTNSQYMRFRLLALSAKHAQQSVNYDSIIQEILNQDL